MTYATLAALSGPTSFDYPQAETAAEQQQQPRVIRVFFGPRLPAWVDAVFDSLDDLGQLQDNWDGRGARALNVDDVIDGLEYLQRVMRGDTRAPHLVPLNSGGLQLTWHVDGLEVEAIFDRRRGERLLLVTAGSHESEEEIDSSEGLFASLADRLAR